MLLLDNEIVISVDAAALTDTVPCVVAPAAIDELLSLTETVELGAEGELDVPHCTVANNPIIVSNRRISFMTAVEINFDATSSSRHGRGFATIATCSNRC